MPWQLHESIDSFSFAPLAQPQNAVCENAAFRNRGELVLDYPARLPAGMINPTLIPEASQCMIS